MKKYIFNLLLLFTVQMGLAQKTEVKLTDKAVIMDQNVAVPDERNTDNQEVYEQSEVDTQAEFPGGVNALKMFVAKHYKMPDVDNLKGKVLISFHIEKNGWITDIKVVREIGHGTGEEAIKLMKKSPNWIPAIYKGKKVKSKYMFPITIATKS